MNSSITHTRAIYPISQKDKVLIDSFLKKLEKFKSEQKNTFVLLTWRELKYTLNKKENRFLEKILSINPKKFGVLFGFLENSEQPKQDMIAIRGQKYSWEKKKIKIPTQYLPKQVHKEFLKMNGELKKSVGSNILISSGYRSPAYQLLIFLYWFYRNEFDFIKTIHAVSLPGYSEHGYPPKQGMDFVTEDGVSWGNKISFDETEEYRWLLKNGKRFGFYLSYPKNNPFGIKFEPWHWHYSK